VSCRHVVGNHYAEAPPILPAEGIFREHRRTERRNHPDSKVTMSLTQTAQAALLLLSVVGIVVGIRWIRARRNERRTPRWLLMASFAAGAIAPYFAALLAYHPAGGDTPRALAGVAWSFACFLSLATSIASLYVSLRADPARGRSPRCRARRSRALAGASAIALACAYVSLKAPLVDTRGISLLIPATPLIVALPYVPRPMLREVTGNLLEQSTGGSLWPWQQRLLRWRARRYFRGSTDLERLEKLAPFTGTPPAIITDKAALLVLESVLDREHDGLYEAPALWNCMPEHLSEPAAGIFADRLRAALGSSLPAKVRVAALLTWLAPSRNDELVAPLVGAMDGAPAARETVLFALSEMSETNSRARDEYLACLNSAAPSVRRDAIRGTSHRLADDQLVVHRILAALDDPDDAVAIASVHWLCEHIDSLEPYEALLLRAGRDRASLRGNVAWALAHRDRSSNELLSLVRLTLASDDPN
jgi:hypothetical protein